MALTGRFKTDDAAGHRSIKGVQFSPHGYAQEQIAVGSEFFRNALTFTANNQSGFTAIITGLEIIFRFCRSSKNPEAFLLKLHHKAAEVHFPGHGNVFQSTRCSAGHIGIKGNRAALRQNHQINAAALGYTQSSTQIPAILQTVKNQNKGIFASLQPGIDKLP